MSATEELLPCPFCGGEALVNERLGFYWVACEECGASGPTTDKELAIAVWNNRADARSRYAELFGTPERAARTLRGYCFEMGSCAECGIGCKRGSFENYDNVLEWLRGDA